MKREVAFFKDHRANGGKALLETLRALGMTDAQIKRALVEYQKTVQGNAAPPPPEDTLENKYEKDYYGGPLQIGPDGEEDNLGADR